MAKDKAKKITPADPSAEVDDDEKADNTHTHPGRRTEERSMPGQILSDRDAQRRSGSIRGRF